MSLVLRAFRRLLISTYRKLPYPFGSEFLRVFGMETCILQSELGEI